MRLKNGCLLSVVIPVYNAEDYLEESLQSVRAQEGIDFVHDVQIVLVNDGSSDGSSAICRMWLKQYPSNTIYIEQENKGPAAARNRGLEAATGELIHFLDADDKVTADAYREARAYLEADDAQAAGDASRKPLPFVAMRIVHFDSRDDAHILNHKFGSTSRVVDLRSEPESIVVHANSCVFRADAARAHRFDESMRIAEDTKFVFDVLLASGLRYGLLPLPAYRRRRRKDVSSATDNVATDRGWYTDTLRYYWYAVDAGRKLSSDGTLPRFVQYYVMYDLQWRVMQRGIVESGALRDEELGGYRAEVCALVRLMDDEVILRQRRISAEMKTALLDVRNNGRGWRARVEVGSDGTVTLDGHILTNVASDHSIKIAKAHYDKQRGVVVIEGKYARNIDACNVQTYFSVAGRRLVPETARRPSGDIYLLDMLVREGVGFCVEVPYRDGTRRQVVTCMCDLSMSAQGTGPVSAGAGSAGPVSAGAGSAGAVSAAAGPAGGGGVYGVALCAVIGSGSDLRPLGKGACACKGGLTIRATGNRVILAKPSLWSRIVCRVARYTDRSS
ncbi:MAG: glycosyltransferase family 2 protein [Coriobacteriales bacterium]|jgi:glycosyltransferase involved in cell wall biosynthesis|nr:glycosyltransferase family 2 protein [Coriobacteriales bacterium]